MNILHLSDIHFGRNYPEYGLKEPFEKHSEILSGIIRVLEEMDDALKPEHIIFTGGYCMARKKKRISGGAWMVPAPFGSVSSYRKRYFLLRGKP